MSPRLENKVSIITGSSSGLGRAIALRYVQEGSRVVCADLQPSARLPELEDSQDETHALIQQRGGKAIFIKTDVTCASSWQALVRGTVEAFGRLDV